MCSVLTRRLIRSVLVAVVATSGIAAPAWALSLGRISIESSMGQPLLARLEVTQISPEQVASLEVAVAEPERFAATQMRLHPALAGLRATLIGGETARATIRLETVDPITEPFLDVILQFKWAGGQLLRSYTLLLDPANLQASPPAEPVAPALPPPEPPAQAPAAPEAQAPVRIEAAPPPPTPAPPAVPAPRSVTVRAGDTATRVLQNHMAPGVSMDQMLLALLRRNPDAFINGNVNLLKAGARVDIPLADEAQQATAALARQAIRAQTRDFKAYRQRVAQTVPATRTEAPAPRVEGRVQDPVAVVTPAAPAQDRLELSKGDTAQSPSSEQVAQALQAQEQQAQVQALERQVQDLQALAEAASKEAVAGAPAFDPTLPLVDDKEELLTLPNALVTPPADEAPPTPADQARAVVEQLIQHPAAMPSGLGLIGLLAVLGVWRARRRRQSESFQKTAARAAAHTASSAQMAAPSMASAGNLGSSPALADAPVDPLAEAEVYLAYGMDEQAESMLRHALAQDPDSLLARMRLLDIYHLRGDVLAFNTAAHELYELTEGLTSEWETVAALGRAIDPSNPLYHPMVAPPSPQGLQLPDEIKDLSLDLNDPPSGPQRRS